jgi:hypothetical protein
MSAEKPSLGRHRRTCSVCRHAKCAEIEADFIEWGSPTAITAEYKLSDRSSIYRHAHALGLFAKRQRNVRAALERIIEKAAEVDVTAASVVAAVQAYCKINSLGQWIDRSETVDLNELFGRMTGEELETYARDGTLPGWFTDTLAGKKASNDESTADPAGSDYQSLFATLKDSQEDSNPMKKHEDRGLLPATTNPEPRPDAFPLESLESRVAARTMAKRRAEQDTKEPYTYEARLDGPAVVYDLWPRLPISEAKADKFPQLQQQDETSVSAPLPAPGESIDDPPTPPKSQTPVRIIKVEFE